MFVSVALSDTGRVRGINLRTPIFAVFTVMLLSSGGYFTHAAGQQTVVAEVQAAPVYEEKISQLENEKVARTEQIKVFAQELGVLQARLDRFDAISERLFDDPQIGAHLNDVIALDAQGGFSAPQLDVIPNIEELQGNISDMQGEMDTIATLMQAGLQLVTTSRMNAQQKPSVWPVVHERTRLTSTFGYRKDPFGRRTNFHGGSDFSGGYNAPIVSSADGIVVFSGYRYNYGIMVEIRHASGFSTRYAHMNAAAVKNGQQVSAGELIGLMGSTGRSTGPHLHFEVLLGDTKIDPLPFVKDVRKEARALAAQKPFAQQVALLAKAKK